MFKKFIVAGLLGAALFAGGQDSAYAKDVYVTHVNIGDVASYDVYADSDTVSASADEAQVALKYVKSDGTLKKVVFVKFDKQDDGSWEYKSGDCLKFMTTIHSPHRVHSDGHMHKVLEFCEECQ